MIAAVLDTNVLVSGIAGRQHSLSPPTALVAAWRASEFELVLSVEILAEVERTLCKPYFAQHINDAQRLRLLALLRRRGRIVTLTRRLSDVASHPADDLILSAAVSAKADYLVTGDQPLQTLRLVESVHIVSPREFWHVLLGEG